MNGTPVIPTESTADRAMRFGSALVIIGGLLVFLYFALLSLDTAALTESAEGIIVGGFVSIITVIVNSLFQGEATRAASRQSAQATQAGVTAAMTPPPNAGTPTATVTEDGTATATVEPPNGGQG